MKEHCRIDVSNAIAVFITKSLCFSIKTSTIVWKLFAHVQSIKLHKLL